MRRAIGANQRAVIFGGYGRAYDRNLFDYLQLERTKSTFPTVNFNFAGDPNHPCSGTTCVCTRTAPSAFRAARFFVIASTPAFAADAWSWSGVP